MLHGAGLFTYMWAISKLNDGKYSIHIAHHCTTPTSSKQDADSNKEEPEIATSSAISLRLNVLRIAVDLEVAFTLW